MAKYRVKEGQLVINDGKEYKPGAIVELDPAEAEEMDWAVEPADAKAGK